MDIGAHIGTYTVLAANLVEKGQVVAIEAHPHNYRLLMNNIKLNGLKNTIAINTAVFSDEGSIKLYSGKTSGWHSVIPERESYVESDYITVPCTTIDSILRKLNVTEVNWIKIDVEGAELGVLKGAASTLRSSKNVNLLIELHSNQLETILYLESFGLHIRVLGECVDGRQHIHACYN